MVVPVSQSICSIQAAAATWERGTTKLRSGNSRSSGAATRTKYSRSCWLGPCVFAPKGQLACPVPDSRAVFTCTSIMRRFSDVVKTARMSVRSKPSHVRAGAQPRRAYSEATWCSPMVFVCFVSTTPRDYREGEQPNSSSFIATVYRTLDTDEHSFYIL